MLQGKPKIVAIDKCTRAAFEVDECVCGLQIVNSADLAIAVHRVPHLTIDKSRDVTISLERASAGVQIVWANCAGLALRLPLREGEAGSDERGA